ncbi:MAG: hypothetical protein WKF40_04105 [Thermoleophilaceae bacterium]
MGRVQYDVKIYSPLRQELIDDEDEKTGGRDVNRVSVRGKLALGYEDVLSDYTDDDFNGPGVYYLGVSTDPLFEDDETAAVQIPVSLRIDVGGRAQPSSRDYTGRLIPEGGAGSDDPLPRERPRLGSAGWTSRPVARTRSARACPGRRWWRWASSPFSAALLWAAWRAWAAGPGEAAQRRSYTRKPCRSTSTAVQTAPLST